MPTYERLDYGSDDGSQWGVSSTDLIAVYGEVPVNRYATVGAASTFLGTSSGAGSTTWGFSTAAMLTSMILQVSTITVALRRIGIVT